MRASNAVGASTVALSITVNDVPPMIIAAHSSYVFTTEVPASIAVQNNGGAVVGWSIDPALPAGLALNTVTGTIAGIPSAASVATDYALTAHNSGGSSAVRLNIAVESGVLLELGHADWIKTLRSSGARSLSQDLQRHWTLWDTDAARAVAGGSCSTANTPDAAVELAGGTLIIRTATGFEVRSASDGHLEATIATEASWWKVSPGGSYFAAGNGTALSVWSAAGRLLLTRNGDYSRANVFAAFADLRLAQGAAGDSVVETITIETGTSSMTPPFEGAFFSWFADG